MVGLVPPGGQANQDTWDGTLARVRADTADGNERLHSSLQDGEKPVLRVPATGGSIVGTQGHVLGLPTGTAQHARRTLVDKGHLIDVGGRHRLVDPVFADWIAHRFPL